MTILSGLTLGLPVILSGHACTLLMDLNLFIFFLFELLCLNYPPGLNHRIIFNILDMTPQTIDLTELIFFGWSE